MNEISCVKVVEAEVVIIRITDPSITPKHSLEAVFKVVNPFKELYKVTISKFNNNGVEDSILSVYKYEVQGEIDNDTIDLISDIIIEKGKVYKANYNLYYTDCFTGFDFSKEDLIDGFRRFLRVAYAFDYINFKDLEEINKDGKFTLLDVNVL